VTWPIDRFANRFRANMQTPHPGTQIRVTHDFHHVAETASAPLALVGMMVEKTRVSMASQF
jgi:hypothetical protein